MDGGQQLRRRLRQQLQGLDGLALQVEEARLDLGAARVRLGDAHDAGDQERPAAQELHDLEALIALADEVVRAVRRRDVAHEVGDGADRGACRRVRARPAPGRAA